MRRNVRFGVGYSLLLVFWVLLARADVGWNVTIIAVTAAMLYAVIVERWADDAPDAQDR